MAVSDERCAQLTFSTARFHAGRDWMRSRQLSSLAHLPGWALTAPSML